MSVKIFHNPMCSKSRATMDLLAKNGVTPDVVKYLDTPPSAAELKDILKMLGTGPRTLIRKSEAAYKELGLADESLSDDQLIDAMVANPKLIERPIVVNNGKAAIGRPPTLVLDIL